MKYWAEERNEIIPEVDEALQECKRWNLEIGYNMEDIKTAGTDKLNVICTEVEQQLTKLQELHKKLLALAYATERA